MSTIKQLFNDAITYDEPTLAYVIWHLVQEGKARMEDDESILDSSPIDNEKVEIMLKENVLGFNFLKVFSLKMNDKQFIFIFAQSEEEAVKHYIERFKKNPINCHEYEMDTPMSNGDRFFTFRQLAKEFQEFPAVAGQFEKRG